MQNSLQNEPEENEFRVKVQERRGTEDPGTVGESNEAELMHSAS